MKIISRKKNALLNIIFGYVAQFGIMILAFIGRKIFLSFLSAEYLGVNGLFSNVLTVLAFAELGLDTAVVYSLYKPVAENDIPKISSLMRYFKRIYIILALIILGLGLLLVPGLNFFVNSTLPQKDVIWFYILFLINTVASYFVAHKVALLSASQKQRVQKIVALVTQLVLQVLHIIVLYIWQNYYIYLITTLLSTIISNICIGAIVSNLYEDVFKCNELVYINKKEISDRVYSTLLYKVGTVLINNTSNILISIIVGTLFVGYYSNYLTVTGAITGFIGIVTTSMISGVGNLAVSKNKDRLLEIFNAFILFYHFVAALGLVGFSLLFDEFITLWLGAEYLFNQSTTFVIAFNFYITTAVTPIWMFREANGLYVQVKYLMIIRAVLNIILSILLGIIWGIFGILLAPIISMVMTTFWYEPKILCKTVFNQSSRSYWIRQLKYLVITALSYSICYFVIYVIPNGWLWLILKAIMIVCITAIIFVIMNISQPEVKEVKKFLIKNKY